MIGVGMAKAFIPNSANGVHDGSEGRGGVGIDSDTQRIIDVLQEESLKVRSVTLDDRLISRSAASAFVSCYGLSDAERIIRWLYSEHYNGEFPVYKRPSITVQAQFMQSNWKWLAETARVESHQAEQKRQREMSKQGGVVPKLRSIFELVR
jgi:hypothetical protein